MLRLNQIFFCVFLFFIFAVIHLLYIGNTDINTGVNQAIDGIKHLKDLFVGLNSAGIAIQTTGTTIKNATTYYGPLECCNNLACSSPSPYPDSQFKSFFADLTLYANALSVAGLGLTGLTSNVPSKLNLATDSMNTFGIGVKNIVVFVCYAIIAFFSIMLALATYSTKKLLIQMGVAFTEIIIIALTVICCALMVIVVTMIIFSCFILKNLI